MCLPRVCIAGKETGTKQIVGGVDKGHKGASCSVLYMQDGKRKAPGVYPGGMASKKALDTALFTM